MRATSRSGAVSLLQSCGELVPRLVPDCDWIAFFGHDRALAWSSGPGHEDTCRSLVNRVCDKGRPIAAGRKTDRGIFAAFTLFDGDRMVGAVCMHTRDVPGQSTNESIAALQKTLRPVFDLATQQFKTVAKPKKSEVLTERTEELEWLFAVTADFRANANEWSAVEQLLSASVQRMNASFGGLAIPEKRLNLTQVRDADPAMFAQAYQQSHPHLMSYVQRQKRPLAINNPPQGRSDLPAVKVLALPVLARNGKVLGMLAFLKPMNEPDFGRRQIYLGRHITRQIGAMLDSQYDLATGLLNRSAFEKNVHQLVKSLPAGAPHAIIYADIDRLHYVNETFGFDVGDDVILRVADLMQPPHIPSDAITARIAGDKFAVFLPYHDAAQAQDCAKHLLEHARRIHVGPQLEHAALSLSCGIARLTSNEQHFSRTLAAAELACKTAKDRGRDRSEVYLDVDESMMRRRIDITGVARLREALDNSRMCVYAQKIVPVSDRSRASGMECLVRFLGDDGSILEPASFLSAAHRFGMLKQLDAWVIRNTLEQLRPHASLLYQSDIYVSINISGPSLHDEDFVGQVSEWVRNSGVAPGLITFEITETAAVSNLPKLDQLMKKLRQIGCRFALDDFGTGVNSLAYLKSLHVDRVKIDGSFVRDLLTNPRSEAMVRAVVQLARNLQIDCVGEYVENEHLFRKLRELGVNYAQGYFVHKPEPLEAIIRSIANDESRRMERLRLEM